MIHDDESFRLHVIASLKLLIERTHHMTASLDALTTQVSALVAVDASALALINGFAARLQAAIDAAKAGDDAAELDALAAELKTSGDALAAAVVANTPSAP